MFNKKALNLANGDNLEAEQILVKNYATGTNALTANGLYEVDITASNTNTTTFPTTTFNVVQPGGGGTNGHAWVCAPQKAIDGSAGVGKAVINGPANVLVTGSAAAGAFLTLNGTNARMIPVLAGTNARLIYGQMLEAKSGTAVTSVKVCLFGCGKMVWGA